MPDDVDLGFAAKLEPGAAIAYFRAKGYGITHDWHEMWQVAHARAFTVAKAARLDILQDIRGALDRALAEGTTRRQFLKDMEPRLRKLGWWGRQAIVGPDGETEIVQLGSPRRLKTIYDVNMRAGFGAARWRQQAADAASRPYLMYDAREDNRVRPAHKAMDGMVFRFDDPIWDTHYPPNGWNCRCRVRALTESQVEARGLQVRDSAGHLREVDQYAGKNRRTGEILTRPGTEYGWIGADGRHHGLLPDAGWSYNPGKDPLGPLPDDDPGAHAARVGGQGDRERFHRPAALPRIPAPERLPRAAPEAGETMADAQIRQIREAIVATGGRIVPSRSFERADGETDAVFALASTPAGDVLLTERFLAHVVEKQHREEFANFILPTLRDPAEIWLQADERHGRILYRPIYVGAFEGVDAVAVVQEDPKHGALSWTFYREGGDIDRRRRGYLLHYREEGE